MAYTIFPTFYCCDFSQVHNSNIYRPIHLPQWSPIYTITIIHLYNYNQYPESFTESPLSGITAKQPHSYTHQQPWTIIHIIHTFITIHFCIKTNTKVITSHHKDPPSVSPISPLSSPTPIHHPLTVHLRPQSSQKIPSHDVSTMSATITTITLLTSMHNNNKNNYNSHNYTANISRPSPPPPPPPRNAKPLPPPIPPFHPPPSPPFTH